jgi:hypothetical protein
MFPDADTRYGRRQPAFLRFPVETGLDDNTTTTTIFAQQSLAHDALLLATGYRLPSPTLSMSYAAPIDPFTEVSGPRRAIYTGRLGHELLLFDDVVFPVDEEKLSAAAKYGNQLQALGQSIPGAIRFALDTLARGALPLLPPTLAALHAVVALEALVNPEGRKPQKATFASRLKVLLTEESPASDGGPPAAVHILGTTGRAEGHVGRLLYEVRSEMIHGGDPGSVATAVGQTLEQVGDIARITLTRAVTVALRGLARHDGDHETILAALRRSWAAADPPADTGRRQRIVRHGKLAP